MCELGPVIDVEASDGDTGKMQSDTNVFDEIIHECDGNPMTRFRLRERNRKLTMLQRSFLIPIGMRCCCQSLLLNAPSVEPCCWCCR